MTTLTWASLARRAWAVLRVRVHAMARRLSIVARRRWRVVMLHRKPDKYSITTAPGQVIAHRRIGGSLLDPRVREAGGWSNHANADVVFRDNLFAVPMRTGEEAVALLKQMHEAQVKATYPH